MRFSRLLVPTSKETPNDATLASHIYLIRGGFIQSVGGSGLYNFLPLGKKILDKVRAVVKDELDKAGCQEVALSFVTPATLWEESGRLEKYGKELLRFKDRKNNDFILGPTHEEMMVNLVRQSVKSYKQLPLNLYQINLKFRDEIRPRFGLMRGREFLMKDGYSFHASVEDMHREFALMEETYKKIFTRLGLEFRVVEADSGAIGGSGSKEFMVLADSGEDTIVVCPDCKYGANIEAAVKKLKIYDDTSIRSTNYVEEEYIFDDSSIENLSNYLGKDKYFFVKKIYKKAIFKDETKIVVFFLRGTDYLEETKATNSIGALELVDPTQQEIEDSGLSSAGPIIGDYNSLPNDAIYRIDNGLKNQHNLIMGANSKNKIFKGMSLIEERHKDSFADISAVQEGDACIHCGGALTYTKGIEAGHIFQLGTQYSEPLGCNLLDENGKSVPMVMGTYGIGVSRLLAGIIEQNHDDKGCIWTKESAPFDLHIIISNIKDKAQVALGEKLYETLKSKGVDVLLDDRKERFGPKIKDFELMGVPHGVLIGKKLADGMVEFMTRDGMLKEEMSSEEILSFLEGKF